MYWFEYNFLFVLAARGKAEKKALGDHTPGGYGQRARFYAISDEGRLNFARGIARYIVFLAENTGLASRNDAARRARCSITTPPCRTSWLTSSRPQLAGVMPTSCGLVLDLQAPGVYSISSMLLPSDP